MKPKLVFQLNSKNCVAYILYGELLLRSNDRELEGELDADLKRNASQNPSIYNMKYKENNEMKRKNRENKLYNM